MHSVRVDFNTFILKRLNMERIVRRIKSGFVPLKRQGLLYTLNLLYIYTISPYKMKVLPRLLMVYIKIQMKAEKKVFLNRNFSYWRQRKDDILKFRFSTDRINLNDMELNREQCHMITKLLNKSEEVVIADIDQNGFLLSHFGTIQNLPMVSKKEFIKRGRFSIKFVARRGYVCIKKDYKGNKFAFINELRALHRLRSSNSNIPTIMDVDFDNSTLYLSYIMGAVLREKLAEKVPSILDKNVKSSSILSPFENKKEWLRRIQEGKRHLYDVVDPPFVERLNEDLIKSHKNKFLWNDLKFGNIIIEKKSGNPYMIDFERAAYHSILPKSLFQILSDQEVELFNMHFNIEK